MKCPNCKYEYWNDLDLKELHKRRRPKLQVEIGEFFFLQTEMLRPDENWFRAMEKRPVFGCPKCNAVFMKDH